MDTLIKNKKKEDTAKAWEKIFRGKPILSKDDAKRMHTSIKSFRNEFNFE